MLTLHHIFTTHTHTCSALNWLLQIKTKTITITLTFYTQCKIDVVFVAVVTMTYMVNMKCCSRK